MVDPKVLEQWYRYEEIAMHFNTLLMQFRLQLFGGAGLLGTMAGYLIGGKVRDPRQRHWLRTLACAGLFVLFAAAASLDVFYYEKLLEGTVAELVKFEAQHPEIQLSTTIERVVGPGKYTAAWAYGGILLVLAVSAVLSFRGFLGTPKSAPRRHLSMH